MFYNAYYLKLFSDKVLTFKFFYLFLTNLSRKEIIIFFTTTIPLIFMAFCRAPSPFKYFQTHSPK